MPKNIGLSLIGAFLLGLAWFNPNLSWLILIAFVPLLLAEKQLSHPSKNIENAQWLLLSGLFALVSTGLIFYQNQQLELISWLSYSAGLTLALMLFKFTKDTLGKQRGYISLPFFWLSAEALHYYYSLGAEPLPLGQAFTENTLVSHWPPVIGYLGMGLWALVCTLVFYFVVSDFLSKKEWRQLLIQGGLALGLFVVLPIFLGPTPQEPSTPQDLNNADQFIARLSFFLAGFQVLFSLVKSYLDKNKVV